MKLSLKEVEHVAHLARLSLSEAEKEMFTEQLNSILDYAAMLDRLDTSGVEPTAHVLSLKNVFREDKVQECLDPELVLLNAPQKEKGAFKVPRIV